MPLAKLRQDHKPTPSAKAAKQIGSDLDGLAATPSPAFALQQRLAQHAIVVPAADVDKWSPRRSLALIVSASAALWLALLMMGVEAFKLIA
jgi:hypothetical protein